MKFFEHELHHTQRNQKALSVLMMDIDFFKSINDEYGHKVGDWELQNLAGVCKNELRDNYYGIIGNYKGLGSFVYRVTQALFNWLNRRSQRKSYNWEGFKELVKHFGIAKPRICHAF
jgi:GGDEF domain-containing protein